MNTPLSELAYTPDNHEHAWSALNEQLGAITTPVAVKSLLNQGDALLKEALQAHVPIEQLLARRTWLVDNILLQLWHLHQLDDPYHCLIAVGGYGRAEMHPGSDIDIAILVAVDQEPPAQRRIENFIVFLWDTGLKIGHNVFTVAQCQEVARTDATIMTNLMESRQLAGNAELYEAMLTATGTEHLWPTRDFFTAKLEEQQKRHHRFNDTGYNLEPNVKEGPGGLRDIQTIAWVAHRHFGTRQLRDLVTHDFLTEEEYIALTTAQQFLWRVRFTLHTLAGRREDRLLFDYQITVARQLGYDFDQEGQRGVERFMKQYYRTVTDISRLNEMLLQLFQEAILRDDDTLTIEYLNARFQLRKGYIEVRHPGVFKRYPFALLEIFLLLQQRPGTRGVRASTIRLIRDHRYLIDDKFRQDIKARSLFMEIIRQPRRIGHELQRMHRYGVLGAYLPVFGAVAGLMQFDLFHVYTVDVHTLFVVQNLRRFTTPECAEELPLCARLSKEIPKPEILYLAGLFHDIAKGRGGDHSELGEMFATDFCQQHGLGQYDTKLVAWLVKHHLLMSTTAQRKDIADPAVVNAFARQVGNKVRLDYLYLLTIADIRATNPNLWNGWKDALLSELYTSTLRALRRGVEMPLERAEWIAETKGEALALLFSSRFRKDELLALWQDLGDDYFLRHWPEEIAWHAKTILGAKPKELPLIEVRNQTRRGGTEIFIYARDQDHAFATTTQVLDQLGLTIMDARIITSASGHSLDSYIVLEAGTNEAIDSPERAKQIVTTLKNALSCDIPNIGKINRRPPRQLKHFTIPTQIAFSDDPVNDRTIMEVIGTDRPGFLSRVARALQNCGVRLKNARVATFGERVEDIFHITDAANHAIHYPALLERLSSTIIKALED